MHETGVSSGGLGWAAGDPGTEYFSGPDVEVYTISSRMRNYICNCFCVVLFKLFIIAIICHTSH